MSQRSTVAVAGSHVITRDGLLSLPTVARGPIAAALGDGDPAYEVSEQQGGFGVENPRQRLQASFTTAGVSVTAGAAHVGLRLRSVGYGSSLAAVGEVAPSAHGNRVIYAHRGVSEWYANGPLGVEQGFTLWHAPVRNESRALTLSMVISGNVRPSLAPGGGTIRFAGMGGAALSYSGLTATDARGRLLRSSLALKGGRLLLRVDTSGAHYPIRVDPFVQVAELTASDGTEGELLGESVAISGETIVVGVPEHSVGSNNYQGAAYVFVEPPSGWANATQTAELTASDGAYQDGLGQSVAISGDTIVAGAPSHQVGANAQQGAAYVFVKPASGWVDATQTAELTASEGDVQDYLGTSVAVAGDTIVAGSIGRTLPGSIRTVGAAYVFSKPASGWANETQTAELTTQTGGASPASLAISGDTIVAGLPGYQVGAQERQGAVAIFDEGESGWESETPSTLLTESGSGEDLLGASVAISGNTVVAGAPYQSISNTHQGAVYVFVEPPIGWPPATTQTAQLLASTGLSSARLGESVAISGRTIVAGAPGQMVGSYPEQGAVYVFAEPATGWTNGTQTQELTTGSSFDSRESLGAAVGASGNDVVAGAPEQNVGTNHSQGMVHVYTNSAPSVATLGVTNDTQSSATLHATVNPNGTSVSTCTFEYGATVPYSHTAPCSPSPGSGSIAVAVSASLSGLSANTLYHYRIVAENASGGVSVGADQTFTTLLNSSTGSTSASDGPLSATTNGGGGTVTVGQYGSNSVGSSPVRSNGKYFDVYVSEGDAFTVLEFTDCELAGGAAIEWYNPVTAAYEHVSDEIAFVNGNNEKCITVTITNSTSPDLKQMEGTVFTGVVAAGPAPTIKKISPKQGSTAGGTVVTITGTGFAGVSAVNFGPAEVTKITYHSATSIAVESPKGTAGTVQVSVTTPNGTSVPSAKGHFKYKAPRR